MVERKSKQAEPKSMTLPLIKSPILLYLIGSPKVTAEYFVNQLVNTPLKPLKRTKSELLDHLQMPDLSSVIIFDHEAHHLWKIDSESNKEVLAPLEKLFKSTQNDSVVTRPRER